MNPYRLESDPTDDVINLDAPKICLEAQLAVLEQKLNNPLYTEQKLGQIALDIEVVKGEIDEHSKN